MIPQPFISVIIPVLNAQQYMALCLEALLKQDYPRGSFEIIVLDNGSVDRTAEIAQKYPIKLFTRSACTISVLRNWGAQVHAKGEIFAFIDADCVAPENWLTQAVQLLQVKKAGAVGCWYALPLTTTVLERTWDILTSIRREKIGPIDWVPGGNFIIRKEVFEKVRGFDEYLITSEDVDICQRIIKSGELVYSHPDVAVKHLGNPKVLKQFFLKEKWRGEGVLQNFLRAFPAIELNNALIFGMVSFVFAAGILGGLILWMLKGWQQLFFISVSGLLAVSFLMTIKILWQRSQWHKFFILWPLFTLYGLARGSSVLSTRVWKGLLKDNS